MFKRISYSVLIGSVVVFGLSGCAPKEPKTDPMVAKLQAELAKKNEELAIKEKTIQAYESKEANAQKKVVEIGTPSGLEKKYPLLPPDAKAGECYARVLVPAKYRWIQKRVLKKSGAAKYKIIPAKYRYVEKRVKVANESFKYITVPATYKYVKDKVLVEPVKYKIINIPTKYKTIVEKRLVKPAYETWKQGRGPYEKIDNHTGEIICKVRVPAQYETIKKTIVETPAHTKKITIPAKYRYIKRKVIDKPAYTKKVIIPAKYKIIKVKELVSPAKKIELKVPQEYQIVKRKEIVEGEHMKWEQILCKTNTTPEVIKTLQTALKSKGFYKGPIDGIYGPETSRAVHAFQKANHLSSGALTLKTLESLNIL